MYGATTMWYLPWKNIQKSVDVAETYNACPLQTPPMATNGPGSRRPAFGDKHTRLFTVFLGQGLNSLDTTQ